MTDMLDEAIGAVRFANGQTGNVHFVATIMKAVARGELIRATPEALAAAPEVQKLVAEAEALVLERAARVVTSLWKWDDDGWLVERPDHKQAEAAIRAEAAAIRREATK